MPPVIAYIAWISRADYPRFFALDPDGLQPTYKQWLKQAQQIQQELERRGIVVERVVMDPDQFTAWSAGAGIDPKGNARSRFAVEIGESRREQ